MLRSLFGFRRSTHDVLAKRAKELNLDDREIAARAGVDPMRALYALESDIDLEGVLSVSEVKRILRVVDLDFLELFSISCAFCRADTQRYADLRDLPRDALIARRREELQLSSEDLLVRLGVSKWFEENSERKWAQDRMRLWRALEDGPDAIDDLSLDQVRLLNKVLTLPLQLLTGVRCAKCGL